VGHQSGSLQKGKLNFMIHPATNYNEQSVQNGSSFEMDLKQGVKFLSTNVSLLPVF
jgi:hypothetical protein